MIFASLVIDDQVLSWIYGALALAIPAIGGTVVVLWKKFIAYITPKVTNAFEAHTGLVNEMKTQIPIVGEALKKLGETQDKQCETLERHSEKHEETAKMLKQIAEKLSSSHDAR